MRRVSILVVLPLVLAIVGLVVGLGPDTPSAQQPPQKVVFALNWFPVGDHAAYWVALEKGYYRQRGLDVDMQNSKGSGDSIAKVDTGRADVGLADSAVVIASAARGTRIKVGTRASLKEVLTGPARVDDGSQNLAGAIRSCMGVCGARSIREFQEVEMVIAPAIVSEGKQAQTAQRVGMGAKG